ncbi:calcineurin-like phosphoesterase family protein [Roseiarcaceae bacterium H3SJ34-1]|uniref:calcineurin-like phosphoesterase C-terminal domain-containing protein n=1 Tax=Terripilifer ovatus TaxID=3032367 RepID=UPI003AB93220|nr:calcineurin-like phosphoesterase family protein [Roseiarcaceae bacterium H3SJ34-1]
MRTTRRNVLMSGVALAGLMTLPAASSASQTAHPVGDYASGRVLEGARGIEGVLVSNGVDVVASDSEGFYRLPLRADATLFAIKPAHYRFTCDPVTNLPLHYRPYREGEARRPMVHDFILQPSDEPDQFEVVLFADPQPETHRHIDHIRDGFVRALVNTTAKFGLTLGDICGDNLALLDRYDRVVGQIGIPWWNVGGNHDLDYDARDSGDARRTFRARYGPNYYAFQYAKTLFVMLDNVEYAGVRPDGAPGGYRGRIGAAQMAFLGNLLQHWPKDRLIVLGMHIPLQTNWNPQSVRDNTADWQELVALLAGRRAVSFAGHMHTTEHSYLAVNDGSRETHHHHVLAAISGSWWSGPDDYKGMPLAMGCDGCPSGYHILSIDGADYTTTFHALDAAEGRMRVEVITSEDATDVFVNLFDGGPMSHVHVRSAGGEKLSLSRVRRTDPLIEAHYTKPDADRRSWIKAEPCEHLGHVRLPQPALSSQVTRLQIEARDEYGRLLTDTVIVEHSSDAREMTSHG